MEGSFLSKRTFDQSSTTTTTTDRSENGNKRRHNHHHQHHHHHHHHHHHPPTPSSSSSMNFKPPPPPLKLSAGETLFRILCPAIKTGGVIGKGGAIIRQFREETGAKIRIDEAFPGCDERVIFIVAETLRKRKENSNGDGNGNGGENDEEDLGGEDEVSSPAQQALLRVFERMLKVDEERLGVSGENEDGQEEKDHKTDTSTTNSVMGGTNNQSSVVCRLLAPSHQVGCVLGRGGKIVEKIRQASGAQIRILPKEHIPPCAFPGDELIQITGNHSAVKKALFSVSSCLQDNSRPDATNSAAPKSLGSSLRGSGMPVQVDQFLSRGHSTGNHALDYHSRNYSSIPGSESTGASHRKVPEEEVVFRLLCHLDKVGSLIGKGGAIIRALQSDTCASIKIADAAPDSDERVVLISARENLEQSHSPAQDAVIRVQSRIAEIGFEPGAAVVARLLVPSQQIGCLLGKGGNVISEMRRATGASIRIFAKEQVPKCGAQNDEVVQVIGSLQSVQDALYHITGRLREALFPMKPPFTSIGPPPYMCGPAESPIPLFRPRYDPASPGHYPSSNGFSNERTGPPQPMDRQPVHLHGMDHSGVNRGPYPYGNERSGHGPIFDPHSSPRSWAHQSGSNGNLRCTAEVGTSLASRNGLIGSGSQMAVSTSVEVVVPLEFWGSICGEDDNLSHVRQISGATVVAHDLRPGSTEGVVFVSGTSDQIDAAQSLIQAFILSGQATP